MAYRIEEHPGILLKKAARLFEQVANQKLDALGVTHAQTVVLIRLWERDGQNQIELTKSAGLDQSTMVCLLNRMERDGLVRRDRNKDDKRVYNFFLTIKAKKICQKLEKHSHAMTALAHKSLSKNDIKKMMGFISIIIANLETFLEE